MTQEKGERSGKGPCCDADQIVVRGVERGVIESADLAAMSSYDREELKWRGKAPRHAGRSARDSIIKVTSETEM